LKEKGAKIIAPGQSGFCSTTAAIAYLSIVDANFIVVNEDSVISRNPWGYYYDYEVKSAVLFPVATTIT